MCYLRWRCQCSSAGAFRQMERTSIRVSLALADVVKDEQVRELQAMLSQRQEAQYSLRIVYYKTRCYPEARELERPLYSNFKEKCKNAKLFGCGCGGRGAGSLALNNKEAWIHLIHHGDGLWFDVEASVLSCACIERVLLRINTNGNKVVFMVPIYTATKT